MQDINVSPFEGLRRQYHLMQPEFYRFPGQTIFLGIVWKLEKFLTDLI